MSSKSSRREFLSRLSKTGIPLITGGSLLTPASIFTGKAVLAGNRLQELIDQSRPARFWTSTASKASDCLECHSTDDIPSILNSYDHDETVVRCQLCDQGCFLKEGERGKCRVRIVSNGELRTLSYGRPVSVHVDPIEKKPFYHFLPGARAFSLATAGCPLRCKFCQNWQISQMNPEDHVVSYITPDTIAYSAQQQRAEVIAFTYNEPTVFTEYLLDISKTSHELEIRNVMISCGIMQHDPLVEMCNHLDAIKIDLKGFSKSFYEKVCEADLKAVLRSIKQVSKTDTHLEIVNLVVPSLNDSDQMLNDLCEWIMGEIGPDVPIHFTRFHPDYQLLNLSPTPVSTLERARDIALDKGIRYPFVGNVPGHPGNHTYCYQCGKPVIKRHGFFIEENKLDSGKCKYCKTAIAGVWQ